MFCPACGTKNPDDARFCASCGKPLPQGGGTADNSVSAGTPSAIPTGAAQKRGHKPPMPVIVGGIVAAVVVIAAAAFALIPRGPEVRDCLNDYSWDEISQISQLISKKGDQNGAI